MIEHVAAPDAFVKSLAGMLAAEEEAGGKSRDGGHLVLTTINRTAKAYLLAILGAEYIVRMVPKGKYTRFFFHRLHSAFAFQGPPSSSPPPCGFPTINSILLFRSRHVKTKATSLLVK